MLLHVASDEQEEGKEPSFVERFLIGKGSNLALAILCSKMLIPIKVPAAMALTPYVQRWARARTTRFKGSL